METPIFSIVMPAYNVEKYIGKAIESIQTQTFQNWELLVVNDCTPDESGSIAEKYARSDLRIQVITHDQNQGLSAARNTGMDKAKGEYIWFVDSDDWVEENTLETVYESLERNRAQFVVFGLQEEYYDAKGVYGYTHTITPKEQFFETAEQLRPYIIQLEQDTLYGYAWNKVYELSHLRKLALKYEDVKLIEDIVFNVAFTMDIASMNTLAFAPYHYAKRLENSLTNKFVPDYYRLHKRRIEIILEQYKYWEQCTDQLKSTLGSLYARYILSAMQRNCDKRAKMNHAVRYQWCQAVFGQSLFQELIPYAKARDSKLLNIFITLLRWKKAFLCMIMGRFVHIAKNQLPFLYAKIKSNR